MEAPCDTLSSFCALACGGEETPDTTNTLGDTGTDAELPMLEGTWTTEQFSPAVDPCGLYNPADPQAYVPFSYELSAENGNTFVLEGAQDDWTCTVNGNGFTCDTPTTSQPVGYGLSADLTIALGLSGVVMSESHPAPSTISSSSGGRRLYSGDYGARPRHPVHAARQYAVVPHPITGAFTGYRPANAQRRTQRRVIVDSDAVGAEHHATVPLLKGHEERGCLPATAPQTLCGTWRGRSYAP